MAPPTRMELEALKTARARPLGMSLARWREWVEADDPKERLLNGTWNRIDRVIPFARRPTPSS